MLAALTFVEKEFEMWPGKLRLMAAGEGARDALDAGMDAVRELSAPLIADAELLAGGSAAVLPRGRAGRLAAETFHMLREALPADVLPPALAALPGAVCDAALMAMREAGGVELLLVTLGDAMAVHQEAGVTVPARAGMPPVLGEFLGALGAGMQGGVATGGIRSGVPTGGLADLVAVQARSAAAAGFVAAILADAADVVDVVRRDERPRDRLMAAGWSGRPVSGGAGLIAPEVIWQALSAAVRRASALREKRLLRAVALGLKGRGRTVGPVDGDRLLRFGVSEWR